MSFNSTIPVVTFDGLSGSGKGTISLLVANKLGWNVLDSGAIYRTLVHFAKELGIDVQDEVMLRILAILLPIEFRSEGTQEGLLQVLLNKEDITITIRSESYGKEASKIATLPSVREALLDRQRAFLIAPGLVADGRDMGTEVFPNAVIKFFLEASVEERAQRRFLQLKKMGLDGNLQCLIGEIAERDKRDKERVVAPLRPADDAIVIDTNYDSINVVFQRIFGIIEETLC